MMSAVYRKMICEMTMTSRSLLMARPSSASRQAVPSPHFSQVSTAAVHHCQMCSAPALPCPQRGQTPKYDGRVSKCGMLWFCLHWMVRSLRSGGIMSSGRLAHAWLVMSGEMHSGHQAMPSSGFSASLGEGERQTSCTRCELQQWHLCSTLSALGLQRARPGRALHSMRRTLAASVVFCALSSVCHSLPSPGAHLLLLDLSLVHAAKCLPCTRCQVMI